MMGSHFQKLVSIYIFNSLFQTHDLGRYQAQSFVGAGGTGVGQVFGLADIDIDVDRLAALSHDHAGVDLLAGSDEHLTAVLSPENAVGDSRARLKSNQGAGLAVGNISLIGGVAVENRVHDPVALGVCHKITSVTDEAAGGNHKGQTGVVALDGSHIDQLALALAQLLDDIARKLFGNIDDALFDGLKALSFFIVMIDDLGLTDGEFIALAAHGLDKNRQMQFSAAGNLEGLGRISILYAQGDICIEFSVKTVADVTAGHILAVFAGEGGIIDIERHGDRGLRDLLERNRHRAFRSADGVADMQIVDS